jgi:hypothetical protein
MKKLNFEKWFETYRPIPNPIDKNGTYCGVDSINYSFETYGEEKEFVAKQDPKFIWTLVEGDKHMWIQNGAWLVNRLCYFVCDKPYKEERGEISFKY